MQINQWRLNWNLVYSPFNLYSKKLKMCFSIFSFKFVQLTYKIISVLKNIFFCDTPLVTILSRVVRHEYERHWLIGRLYTGTPYLTVTHDIDKIATKTQIPPNPQPHPHNHSLSKHYFLSIINHQSINQSINQSKLPVLLSHLINNFV